MQRISSVDCVRAVAILAVISIHTQPFSKGDYVYFGLLWEQLARFAVPFFFVVSGYFWGKKIGAGAAPGAASETLIRRTALVFVSWSLIYLGLDALTLLHEQGWNGALRTAWTAMQQTDYALFALQGPRVHLWFLVALMFAAGISGALVQRARYVALALVSVGLYGLVLVTQSYAASPFGVSAGIETRDGPFVGTIFFATGYFLSRRTPAASWFAKGSGILAAGFVLAAVESFYLWRSYGVWPAHSYLVGTYLMGVGAAAAALSGSRLISSARLAGAGRYTLGVYASHPIFVGWLRPYFQPCDSPIADVLLLLSVAGLSLAFAYALSLPRLTRKIVV